MERKLFEPTHIGKMKLKNRIVMPPMALLLGSEDGAVTQRQINFFVERAKHGVGLIVVEDACVDSTKGAWGTGQQKIDDDKYIPMYRELTDAIHENGDGVKVSIQLDAAGRNAPLATLAGNTPVSASAIEGIEPGVITREMTLPEIEQLETAYVDAARRAKIAGFDAVNILGAGGYMVNQFMSPLYNLRADAYGGELKNRMRFALHIVRRVKQTCGPDFPVIWEINCDEYAPGGIDLAEAKKMAVMLEAQGVDAFRIHRGSYDTYHYIIPPAAVPHGVFVQNAAGIKSVVKQAKVWVEGRMTLDLAEEVLAQGKSDLIGFGRAFLADPEWPQKLADGREAEIRKCIVCNRCVETIFSELPVRCSINPTLGHEEWCCLEPAVQPKKLVVVGGGPAGLQAACIAAERGHRVMLYEKNEKLGGQVNMAYMPPEKAEMKNIVDYLTNRIVQSNVTVHMSREAGVEEILASEPDAVIIATGATPIVPKFVDLNHKKVCFAWDVLLGRKIVGDKVVIIGGGSVGCETAEYLSQRGKRVTVIEMLPEFAVDVEPFSRIFMLECFEQRDIKVLTDTKVEKINDDCVVRSKDGNRQTIPADTIVLAIGAVPNDNLTKELATKVKEIYAVGDCKSPRRIREAIKEGFRVAREI